MPLAFASSHANGSPNYGGTTTVSSDACYHARHQYIVRWLMAWMRNERGERYDAFFPGIPYTLSGGAWIDRPAPPSRKNPQHE